MLIAAWLQSTVRARSLAFHSGRPHRPAQQVGICVLESYQEEKLRHPQAECAVEIDHANAQRQISDKVAGRLVRGAQKHSIRCSLYLLRDWKSPAC
jgi:hypothetical protein